MYYLWLESYWTKIEPFGGLSELEMAYHYRKYGLRVVKSYEDLTLR